jgi:hypothetical protein
MDYGRRVVEFSDPFVPTGNLETDLEFMKSFFRRMKGKHPEQGVL